MAKSVYTESYDVSSSTITPRFIRRAIDDGTDGLKTVNQVESLVVMIFCFGACSMHTFSSHVIYRRHFKSSMMAIMYIRCKKTEVGNRILTFSQRLNFFPTSDSITLSCQSLSGLRS